ncbi:hypothetical protein T4E_4325 [Trichinella pseudospiralis]|uniref:Uncharacterized protein n=1 Tax=Trichinella pseudospiralis TaxID=6337 RepID=A0A0V0XK68_TRIPS|nr:hypothetical protein T4E_4325 [Trichinella pseudospiralis]
MADFSEQRLVPTRSNRQRRLRKCNVDGFKGVIESFQKSLVAKKRNPSPPSTMKKLPIRPLNSLYPVSETPCITTAQKRSPRLLEHRHNLVIPYQFKTTNCGVLMAHLRLYHNGINSFLPSMPLWLCGLYVYCLCTRTGLF